MHFTYLCYSQSYLNILDRSISVGIWDFNRQHEWWNNVLLAYLFRFCEDACSTLWCCWSKTNFWSRTSFRVGVQNLLSFFNKLGGLWWFKRFMLHYIQSSSPKLDSWDGWNTGRHCWGCIDHVSCTFYDFLSSTSSKIGFTVSNISIFTVMQLLVEKFHQNSPLVYL